MIINHNMGALNANRQMGINQSNANKSMEKLSSGLRINRAGDDAAGLAISEKMRGQIRGLDQASSNAQDGISLIQTAEGALSETHSILQRMRELAVQSSNDTNTTSDRDEIQKEINQLTQEIDRIGNTTEFNTKKLLNGESGVAINSSNSTVNGLTGTANTKSGTVSITANKTTLATSATVVDASYATLDTADTLTAESSITINGTKFDFTATDTVQNVLDTINEKSASTGVKATFSNGTGITFTSLNEGSSSKITTTKGTGMFAATNAGTVAGADAILDPTELGGSYTASGNKVTVTSGDYKGLEFTLTADADVNITIGTNNSLKMHIGANEDQNMSIVVNDMRASALGVASLDVTSQDTANNSITTINKAIETVSAERSKLGAYQNRLEHTINNLGTSSENLTSAESRIRDVNMAKEMSTFSKNNILSQAAQAMLAQANNQPQQVLQLLR